MHYLKQELYDLIKSDERIFEFIQTASLDGLWYWDLENPDEEWMNPKFWTTLGYNPDEMPHRSEAWQNIIHPDDLILASENTRLHFENPEHPFDQLLRYQHKKGHTVWIRCRGIAIRNSEGRPIRMLGAHTDVTGYMAERKVLEETNLHLRFLNQLLLNVSDFVFVLDSSFRFLSFYRSSEEKPMNKETDFIGKQFSEVPFPEAARSVLLHALKQAASENRKIKSEYSLFKDGSHQFYEVSIAPIFFQTDKILQFVCVVHNITHHKKVENDLRRLALVASKTSESIIITDEHEKTIWVNAGFTHMTGFEPYDILGKKPSLVLHGPKTDVETKRKLRKAIEEKKEIVKEVLNYRKDGSEHWIDLKITPVFDDSGRCVQMISVARDITERKKADQILRDNEQMLADLAHSIPGLLMRYTLHPDGKDAISFISRGVEDLYGISQADALKNVSLLWEKIHPDDLPAVVASVQKSAEEESPWVQETRIILDNGIQKWIIGRGTPRKQSDGSILWHTLSLDITDQKVAKLKLEEELNFRKGIVENTPGVVYQFAYDRDMNPKMLFVSDRVFDIFGFTAEEVYQKPTLLTDCIHPDDKPLYDKQAKESYEQLTEFYLEGRIIRKDGEIRWIDVRSIPDRTSDGGVRWIGHITDTTEQNETKEALRKSREQYKLLFETNPLPMWVYENESLRFLEVNEAAIRHYGYSREEFLSMTLLDIRKEKSQADLKNYVSQRPDSFAQSGIWKHLLKSGVEIEVDIISNPIEFGGKKARLVVAVDVTKQQKAERKLKESEHRLHVLTENFPNGSISLVSTDLILLYTGGEGYRGTPYKPEDMVGKPLKQVISPDVFQKIEESIPVLLQGKSVTHEISHGDFHFLNTYKPVLDENGQVSSFVLAVTDISERKKVELALERNNEVLAQAERITATGSWELDIIANKLYWSDEVYRIAGFEPRSFEVTFEKGLSVIHPDDQQRAIAVFGEAIRTGQVYQIEKRFVRPDGTIRFINSQGKVLSDETGKPTRLIGIFQDITDRKRAEEELVRTKNMLADTNRVARVGGWSIDFIEKIIFWSDLTLEIHEVASPDVFPEDFEADLIFRTSFYKDGFSRERITTAIQKARTDGSSFDEEVQLVTAKGKEIWVRVLGHAEFHNGVCSRIFGAFYDIDERKRIELELKRAKEILSQSSRIARVGGWEYDVENGELIWSDTMREIHEVSADFKPALDETLFNRFMKDLATRQILMDAMSEALEKGNSFDVEILITTAKGRENWVRSIGHPEIIDGKCIRLFGAYADIDNQKRTEEALRRSESEFKALAENSPDIITRFDRNHRHVYVNPAVEASTGIPVSKWIGKTHAELGLTGPMINDWLERQTRIFITGEEESFEFTFDGITGRQHYHCVLMPERDSTGHFETVLSVARDISSIKNAEAELRKSQQHFATIFRDAPLGVAVIDSHTGEIMEANSKYAEILGISLHDLLLKAWADFTHPDDIQPDLDNMARMNSGETDGFWMEKRYIKADKSILWVSMTIRRMNDGKDGRKRHLCMVEDITSRKEIEADLKKARLEADRANAAKSSFLASMSHEIRTPLNGVIGFTELLQHTSLSDVQREYVRSVSQSAQMLFELTNDILDFSKIEAGMLELNNEVVHLYKLAEQVMEMVRFRAAEKGLELLLNISPEIPAFVMGDSIRLRQILLNLVGNAVKFTERGEVELIIQPGKKSQKSKTAELFFAVRDTGIGISKTHQKQIFLPFNQEDSSITRRFGGTGLGLAISNRLLAMMHSGLELNSEPGAGSTFYFSLRVEKAMQENETPAFESKLKHILLVDDNPTSLSILKNLFEAMGIKSDAVSGVADALGHIFSGEVVHDALFIDFELKNENALDLVRKIRRSPEFQIKNLPVVLMHQTPSDSLLRDLNEPLRISGYLSKPLSLDGIRDFLRRFESEKKQENELGLVQSENRRDGKVTVLVIDDNELNLQLAGSLVKTMFSSAEIVEAKSGKEALEKFEKKRPDLILMDIQMPEMNGYETAKRIREREGKRAVPIIALTAETLKGERDRCLAAGMDDYLSKPITLSQLIPTIRQWLPQQQTKISTSSPNPTSDVSGNQHFNRVALLGRLSGSEAMMQEFLKRIKSGAITKIEEEISVLIHNPLVPETVKSFAHTIKGAAGTACFEVLHALALELETLKPFSEEKALALLEKIKEEIQLLDRLV